MEFFVVRPDYSILSKYYGISIPPNDLDKLNTNAKKLKYLKRLTEQQSKDGIELMIESYSKNNTVFFDDDHVKSIKNQFEELLTYHGLTTHRDNLLFLIVSSIQTMDSAYNYLQHEVYDFRQRLIELSGYIYSLKNQPQDKTFQLVLKSKDRKTGKSLDSVRVTDQMLIHWMSKFVIEAIDSGNTPMGLFGIYENAVVRNQLSGPTTLIELKQALLLSNSKTSQSKNMQTIGRFCLTLIQYLNGETPLRIVEPRKSNDKQLRFLYDICILFDLIDKQFDVDSKDVTPERHMRILLKDTSKSMEKYVGEKAK